MNGSNSRASYIAFTVSSVAIIIFGLLLLPATIRNNQMYSRCTATTTGKVISYHREPRSKKSPLYPTEYIYTVDGITYQYNVKLSEIDKMEVGDDITVHYNPSNAAECHTDFKFDESKGNYTTACFIIVFGIGLLIFDIIYFNKNKKDPAVKSASLDEL